MTQYRILIDGEEVQQPFREYPADWIERSDAAIERGLRITLQRQDLLSSLPITRNPEMYMQLPDGRVLTPWETLADRDGQKYNSPQVIGA